MILIIYVPFYSCKGSNGVAIPSLVVIRYNLDSKYFTLLEVCFAAYPQRGAVYINVNQISDINCQGRIHFDWAGLTNDFFLFSYCYPQSLWDYQYMYDLVSTNTI
jgi:hypothetical protein